MLEHRNYGNIPLENMKDLATTIFVIIDDLYRESIPDSIKYRTNADKKELSDSEIIAIAVLGEAMSNDSEKAWLSFVSRNLRDLFPQMTDRSRFNRVKRNLAWAIQHVRICLNGLLNLPMPDLRIADSAPLRVCEFGRACFTKSFKGYGAAYGYCPSKKETYFGYKLHVLCATNGVVTDFAVGPADVDDREALWELTEPYKGGLWVIGDKGYVGADFADGLLQENGARLVCLKRRNAKEQYPKGFRRKIFKIRRRVETTFSQLADQFKIETTRAKSYRGLLVRLNVKVLAYNLCFFINQLLGLPPSEIPKIKGLVF